jgi:hypothetical protein
MEEFSLPYIKQECRWEYFGQVPGNAGELNFAFTQILNKYLTNKGKSYQTINDIVGALEGCKMEFYARVARPYEDTKIKENGDCY